MKKNTLFFPFFWKWINLIEKVVKIEETIYNKYKGESPYTNRVLEILHNSKTNEEFKQNIIVGKITPDDLATMDAIDMVDKTKRKEINKAIENNVKICGGELAKFTNDNPELNQNFGNNLQSMGNDNMNPNQQIQGQDLKQFLNNFAMLQMMGAGGTGMGGDMNAMMGTNNENNQDNQ